MTTADAPALPDRIRQLLLEARELERYADDVRAKVGELVLQVPLVYRRELARAVGVDERLLELCAGLAYARQAKRHNPAGEADRVRRQH